MRANNVEQARLWAQFYRERGKNPLPSRRDEKRPIYRYAHLWEKSAPDRWFTEENWSTTNLQVMLGRFWRLLVIDLDGPEAIERWQAIGYSPQTWITLSGDHGRHVWFSLPAGLDDPLPKAILWQPDATRPKQKDEPAIERLCDNSLVMAPPSIHPTTGERYRFLDRRHSPAMLPLPADCPRWVLRLRPIVMTRPHPLATSEASVIRPAAAPPSIRFDRRTVLDAIPNKVALARSWGLRIAGRPTAKGWVPVHAIDRDDVHPSAAIHQESGTYVDRGSGLKLSFFDLGVEMNIYRDWRDAASDLGAKYAC